MAIVLAAGSVLGLGATALAQSGGDDDLRIDLQHGCLNGTRVTVRIVPPSGGILSPVHVRAAGHEVVHLTGVTQEASVTVRVPHQGRVSVSGETTGGERFAVARTYRRCTPEPTPQTQRDNPSPPITGRGEG